MDCARAQETLSAAVDREAGAEELAAAKTHSASCRRCAAFLDALAGISAAEPPRAPADLPDRILAVVAEEAHCSEEERLLASLDIAEEPSRRLGFRRSGMPGLAWPLVAVCLATGALSAFVVVRSFGERQWAERERASLHSPPYGAQGPGEAGTGIQGPTGQDAAAGHAVNETPETAADGALALRSDPATAPPYVSHDGRVWKWTRTTRIDASELTTVGAVVTARDSGQRATSWPAYKREGESDSLYVGRPDGSCDRFLLVVRTLNGHRFALTNGATLERYGIWPGLPPGMGEPVRTDGSPGFVPGGSDDASVPVFASAGHRAEEGFAVGPGTAGRDPAAGNPNWTWWEPLL